MVYIISLLFYLVPFITVPVILLTLIFDNKHNLIYSILLGLIFAIIAYNFIPDENYDLYRYYLEMEYYYSHISFTKFLSHYSFGNKYLLILLQYIFAQNGNYRLLPFVITLIGYSLSFYIILDYSKIKNYSGISKVFTLLFFTLTFYHINFISGLAQYLSIIIGFFGFYLEYIKNNKKWIYKIFYILPLFFHISMIIIPLIRLVLHFDFNKIKKVYIIILSMYLILPTIFYKIISLFSILSIFSQKISSYVINGNSLITSYDFFTLFVVIIFIFIFFNYKKIISESLPSKFLDFSELILFLNLFSLLYRDIFSRIFNISILCMSIIILTLLNKKIGKEKIIITILLSVVSLVLGNTSYNTFKNQNFNNIFNNYNRDFKYFINDKN